MKQEEINHNRYIKFYRVVDSSDYIINPSHSDSERVTDDDAFELYLSLIRMNWMDDGWGFYGFTTINPHFPEK